MPPAGGNIPEASRESLGQKLKESGLTTLSNPILLSSQKRMLVFQTVCLMIPLHEYGAAFIRTGTEAERCRKLRIFIFYFIITAPREQTSRINRLFDTLPSGDIREKWVVISTTFNSSRDLRQRKNSGVMVPSHHFKGSTGIWRTIYRMPFRRNVIDIL